MLAVAYVKNTIDTAIQEEVSESSLRVLFVMRILRGKTFVTPFPVTHFCHQEMV